MKTEDYGLFLLTDKSFKWVKGGADIADRMFGSEIVENIEKTIYENRMSIKNLYNEGNILSGGLVSSESPLGLVLALGQVVCDMESGTPKLQAECTRAPLSGRLLVMLGYISADLVTQFIRNVIANDKITLPLSFSAAATSHVWEHEDSLTIDEMANLYYKARKAVAGRSDLSILDSDGRQINGMMSVITSVLASAISKKAVSEGKTNLLASAYRGSSVDYGEYYECARFVNNVSKPYTLFMRKPEIVEELIEPYAMVSIRNKYPFALPNELDKDLYSTETNIDRAAKMCAEWLDGRRVVYAEEVNRVLNTVIDIIKKDMPPVGIMEGAAVTRFLPFVPLLSNDVEGFRMFSAYCGPGSTVTMLTSGRVSEKFVSETATWCRETSSEINVKNIFVMHY